MKPTRHRSPTRLAAIALVAVLGVAACDSQPSAKRVAEDLINTLAETDAERECMLDVVDGYTANELQDIGDNFVDGDLNAQAEATDELAKLEADLAACR